MKALLMSNLSQGATLVLDGEGGEEKRGDRRKEQYRRRRKRWGKEKRGKKREEKKKGGDNTKGKRASKVPHERKYEKSNYKGKKAITHQARSKLFLIRHSTALTDEAGEPR